MKQNQSGLLLFLSILLVRANPKTPKYFETKEEKSWKTEQEINSLLSD